MGGTQSIAEIRSYPLNIIFTEASDVPDMEGNATAALTFHTVDLSGSQMRKTQAAIHAVQAEPHSGYVV